MKNILRFLLFLPVVAAGLALSPQATTKVSAACGQDSLLGIPVWHKYLADGEAAAGKCTPKVRGDVLDNEADVSAGGILVLPIAVALLEAGVSIGALVALVMVFWGAFNFLTSEGEPAKAASARRVVQNAAIGLVILLVSTRVVAFVGATVM